MAIHASGIIHRDIKPQNILLEPDLTPKLSDFGVAYYAPAASLTQAGMTIGTAAYMAPEQATGEQVGPRSDLYAVGVVLYELLTGRLPFAGGRPVQVMYQHVHEEPLSPHSVNPDIPAGLDAVVMRALAKSPEYRYPNAESMRYALLDAASSINEVFVVPPASYANQPTELTPGVPPLPPGSRPPVRGEEPARWPYAIAVLAVAVAVMAVLVSTMGDGLNTLGFGEDVNPTPTGIQDAGIVPTETAPSEPLTPTQEPPTTTPEPPPPTEEPPPETPVPPTPTEEPPTATTEPEPTETLLEPSPTLEPEPTETPKPRVGDTLAESVPANSPFSPDDIPDEILDDPTAHFERDDLVAGGAYRRPDGVLYDMPAAHLYAQTTDYPDTSITITLDEAPSDYAVIRMLGMDDENGGRVPFRISVNGYIVHEGPSPFENEEWTDIAWRVGELEAFQVGENTITIENTAQQGEFGRPPWILLSTVELYVD